MKKIDSIVYVGDFDFRNENVQSHLVKNNCRMLNRLGYKPYLIGVNRNCSSLDAMKYNVCSEQFEFDYLELPYTLTFIGLLQVRTIEKKILLYLEEIRTTNSIKAIISYQAPSYAFILRSIVRWCRKEKIAYVVNSADLPIFDSQPLVRRLVMRCNWNQMHRINYKNACGIIAVSHFINDYYEKAGRPSVVIPPLYEEQKMEGMVFDVNDVPTFIYAGTPFIFTGSSIDTGGMKDRLDYIVDIMLMLEKLNIKFRFVILGITFEDYCICIPRHRALLSQSSSVSFLGRLTHIESLKKIMAADYMINYRDRNTMTEAGLSTKVVESVSVGTPVVINDIGDTFQYLSVGVSGNILSGDINTDVKLLAKLCSITKDGRYQNKMKTKEMKVFSTDKYIDIMRSFIMSLS